MVQSESGAEAVVQPNLARLFICVGIKSWVGAAPHHAWIAEFEIPEAVLLNLRTDAEEIVRAAESLELGRPPFEVSETRGRTSWGADSGEVIRAVLWVGEQAIAALVGAAVLKLFRRLAARDVRKSERLTMSRDEAVERARWVLIARYGLEAERSLDQVPRDESTLVLISEAHSADANAWTVTFRDSGREEYTVELGHLDGLPTASEIRRRTP